MAIDQVINHYFDVLGIQPTTNKSAIKKAYMAKALLLHPDKCGNTTSEAAFKMIGHAWKVLSGHDLSPNDVHGDSQSDTKGCSADELQALTRELDSLKRTVEQHIDMDEKHVFELQALADKQYLLEHKLEQEATMSNDRFLRLLEEQTAYATLSKERKFLQRTVDQQADEYHKQAVQLSQQNSEAQALKAKITTQAVTYKERIVKSETETQLAEGKIRSLEQQLDHSVRFHDALFFLLLVIVVFALGCALSWSGSDV